MDTILPYLIVAHLIGDFILQNAWMQRKSQSSWVCTVHVLVYMIPFMLIAGLCTAPTWLLVTIAAQHWAQDRWALHLKWMKFYGQTTPDKWPVGPLCVDQAMHIGFIGIVCFALKVATMLA